MPRSPWENGYNESFNGKLRDELLNGEILYSLKEAQVLIERWRHHYNTVRPHSALGYKPRRRKPSHPDGLIRPSLWMGYSRISPSQTLCQDKHRNWYKEWGQLTALSRRRHLDKIYRQGPLASSRVLPSGSRMQQVRRPSFSTNSPSGVPPSFNANCLHPSTSATTNKSWCKFCSPVIPTTSFGNI